MAKKETATTTEKGRKQTSVEIPPRKPVKPVTPKK